MHLYLSRVLKKSEGHLALSLKVESTKNNPYMCEHVCIVMYTCQRDTCGGQTVSHEIVGLQTVFPPFLSTSLLAFKFTLYFLICQSVPTALSSQNIFRMLFVLYVIHIKI